ncbi:MAG: hypothetical protein U5R31_03230 [Acidimicrobiia bacterium]|nr:hypothetical protein [Acidimicrobiia bacterium]
MVGRTQAVETAQTVDDCTRPTRLCDELVEVEVGPDLECLGRDDHEMPLPRLRPVAVRWGAGGYVEDMASNLLGLAPAHPAGEEVQICSAQDGRPLVALLLQLVEDGTRSTRVVREDHRGGRHPCSAPPSPVAAYIAAIALVPAPPLGSSRPTSTTPTPRDQWLRFVVGVERERIVGVAGRGERHEDRP